MIPEPCGADFEDIEAEAEKHFQTSLNERTVRVDRMMVWLLAAEWIGMIGVALVVSPRVWNGTQNQLHPHLWAAILAGPCFILPAICIALLCPACQLTRHVIAVAQVLVSSLLIDCTGGRIETHFHIFGSLAFLAFYQDWRVLATASAMAAADHLVRGIWWPQSVYGVLTVSPWRWVEHLWWVFFEDFFLLIAARNNLSDMRLAALGKARLHQRASHDVLTGLANRRKLQESFNVWIDSEPRSASAVLFIDLDRFRQVNDTLGHTVGDKLLALVAARLAEAIGREGTLARIGGDEFVVFLPDIGGDDATESMGHRLLDRLAPSFYVNGHELTISASIGISRFPDHGNTLSALQEQADRAMYVAKSTGRNQCVTFSPEISRREDTANQIARDLSGALLRNELELYFQPLVRRDGELDCFEALLRWHHPVHGTLSPAEFIPMAEDSGLIVSLGAWSLAEACRNCQAWQRPGHGGVGVTVNVSALEMEQPDYPERVLAALAKAGLSPWLLTLELTESLLIRNLGHARAHVERIRRAGIRVALDDFGTGYSSISYLSELPVDMIKLDRTLVGRELFGPAEIIECIVVLAHRLGLQVVAEGIETSEQKRGLFDLMCDRFQGYYFGEPVPARELVHRLERHLSPDHEVVSASVEP